MGRNNKKQFDWAFIAEAYITGDDEVTFEYMREVLLPQSLPPEKIPAVSTMRKHSMLKNWVAQRYEYRNRVSTVAREKAVQKEADIWVKRLRIGQWLQKHTAARLKEAFDAGEVTPQLAMNLLRLGLEIEAQATGMPDRTVRIEEGGVDREIITAVASIIGTSETEVSRLLEISEE